MASEETDPFDHPEEHLEAQIARWEQAMALRSAGQDDKAEALLREILKAEPRLAEPRLELVHIHAGRSEWQEAQAQAQFAIGVLRAGGQWLEALEPDVLLSFALNLLAEVLVRPLEEGDLFLEDRAAFSAQWNRAAVLFQEAHRLDPTNSDAAANLHRYAPLPQETS